MEQQQSDILSPRTEIGKNRTQEIIAFMKGISVYVDPEAEIERLQLNTENMNEQQLMFLITRTALRNAPANDIYNAVITLKTQDLKMLNLSADNLQYFITVSGGFFYARFVKRLISKNDILDVKNILGHDVYKKVIEFSKTSIKNDYPLRQPFKEQFNAVGHRIFEIYFSDLPHIIQEISMMRTGYEKPILDMSKLKITHEYANNIIQIVQDTILKQAGTPA